VVGAAGGATISALRRNTNGPRVKVVNGATLETLSEFLAYPAAFPGGVRVASTDLNGDGLSDIITAPGSGSVSNTRVFDAATGTESRSFLAYAAGFLGGVYIGAN
jgi:hypothetical protein